MLSTFNVFIKCNNKKYFFEMDYNTCFIHIILYRWSVLIHSAELTKGAHT